ncbi:hypothetical protein AAFF_G00414490 [Aldrovandia affinis]|uniref:Uncharacterized protein n=1 Tax=Aldrovandia affinis TaxID=143900 RepID=A0AAD7SAP6_9TELE|nr:hypothetical protein AAFF_G00414490 [Aldrovandia affinis]
MAAQASRFQFRVEHDRVMAGVRVGGEISGGSSHICPRVPHSCSAANGTGQICSLSLSRYRQAAGSDSRTQRRPHGQRRLGEAAGLQGNFVPRQSSSEKRAWLMRNESGGIRFRNAESKLT